MNDKKYADLPLIIFDRGKNVKTSSRRSITQEERDAAWMKYINENF